MNSPNVTLHIDHLVLHGRLVAERGLAPSLHADAHLPNLDGGAIHAAPDIPTDRLASQIAHAVYGGLSR